MSYLKLDRTNINYGVEADSKFLYLSEVIDSDCSYVTPKLIISSEELDIYFGNSFTQRDYYNELLHYGVSLLLYRPIKKETKNEELDLSEYQEIIDYSEGNPKEKDYIFYDNLPDGGVPEDYDPGKYKFYVSTEDAYYIWYEGEYIKPENVPTESISSSELNRDTLRLIDYEFSGNGKFSYCHPKYRNRSHTPVYTEDISEFSKSLTQSIYSHGVFDETRTVAFTLDFSKVKEFRESDYIVFPLSSGYPYSRVQFYFGDQPPLGADIISGAYSHKVHGDTLEDKISWVITSLGKSKDDGGFGYKIIKEGEKKYTIYSSDLLQDQHFYTPQGLVFERNDEVTQNIYSILSEDHKRLEVFSKTIGPGDENIKIKIEKLSGDFKEHYRFTISRYTYVEIFEGPLYIENDPETETFTSLEKIINQGSKLVEIKFYNQGRSVDDSNDGLIPGEYELSRAKSEKDYSPEDYWRALEKIKEFNLSEDFLLVPEIEKYEIIGASSDTSWISEYTRFLEYAEEKNCQVLFSNHTWNYGCSELQILSEEPQNPSEDIMYGVKVDENTIIYKTYSQENGWKIYNSDPDHKYQVHEIEETFGDGYTGNHIFNYTKDTSNRLVYFYQDLSFYGYSRPAYYIFLKGIISGKYSEEVDNIEYAPPVDPYEEENSNLQKWKSNFLSCNNHIFYYKEFFNHPGDWKYETTILTRFCIDKVSNTVSRELPQYLGAETSGEILKGLQGILDGLRLKFPIIYSLDIDYIEEDQENQVLSVYLDLEVKELLEHDIKLSVTLNFNNT